MPAGLQGSLSVVGEVMSFYDILQTLTLHIFKDNLSIFPSSFGNWKLWKLPYKQPNLSDKLPGIALTSMVSQHRMAVSTVCFTASQYTDGKKHYETQGNKWEQIFFSFRIRSATKAQVKVVLSTVPKIWTSGRLETGAA